MQTLIVSLTSLIENYNSNTASFLRDCEDTNDHAYHLDIYINNLRKLVSMKVYQVATVLRDMFADAYTTSLLTPDQFKELETADRNGEDFAIVVRDKNETICILCKNEISW